VFIPATRMGEVNGSWAHSVSRVLQPLAVLLSYRRGWVNRIRPIWCRLVTHFPTVGVRRTDQADLLYTIGRTVKHGEDKPPDRRAAAATIARYAVLALLPAAITASSALAGASKGQAKTNLILLAIFCTLSVSSWNVYKEIQSTKAANSVRVLAQLFSRTGAPLVSLLGSIAAEENLESRRADTNTLIVKILGIAHLECGHQGARRGTTRATFYRFTTAERLDRYRIGEGRHWRAPRPDFDANRDENDRKVIEIAMGENYLLVEDVDNAAPEFFRDYQGRDYRCFLMVPVRAGGRSYGFLSVDSDEIYSLTKIDVGYVTLMSALLGAAMSLLDGEYPDLSLTPHTAEVVNVDHKRE
jgi:hypothetical protein